MKRFRLEIDEAERDTLLTVILEHQTRLANLSGRVNNAERIDDPSAKIVPRVRVPFERPTRPEPFVMDAGAESEESENAGPPPAAEKKAVVPRGAAKPCCGSMGSRHKADCPEKTGGSTAADPDEAVDAALEEDGEPKEEFMYKCINISCEEEGKPFASTNEIPRVMCHACGERDVVQVIED